MTETRQNGEALVKRLVKPSLVVLAAVAILAGAAFASSRLLTSPTPSAAAAKPSSATARPCGDANPLFGHVDSLTPKGDHFELRFDPAWFLSGETASRAMLEDTGSADVPNDNYVVEEGHRLLTYLVPATAHVTVLTGALAWKAITVSQLAQLVKGEQPVKLFEPLDSGVWIRVHIDTVCSLEQQYRP